MLDQALLEDIVDDVQHGVSYHRLLVCARNRHHLQTPVGLTVLSSPSHRRRKKPHKDDTKQFLSSKLEAVDVRLWPSSLFDDPRQVDEVYSSCPDNEPAFTRLWVKRAAA
ncbi:hypothetical protein HPB48_026553 [Haemaphysalis longicornis]|uniref:Uncharacterized protein n=1 Tax=Haemaphysalis longicornis TaxID=44386 RepID=A0A9J6HC51_HAELO|nr:hypothetical protein HPB48_026553 [Haemaphysalis longicornis]